MSSRPVQCTTWFVYFSRSAQPYSIIFGIKHIKSEFYDFANLVLLSINFSITNTTILIRTAEAINTFVWSISLTSASRKECLNIQKHWTSHWPLWRLWRGKCVFVSRKGQEYDSAIALIEAGCCPRQWCQSSFISTWVYWHQKFMTCWISVLL